MMPVRSTFAHQVTLEEPAMLVFAHKGGCGCAVRYRNAIRSPHSTRDIFAQKE